MNDQIPLQVRPPIGFVVEGRGEYYCYPSLVCRIVGASGFKVPRVNAGGIGSVVRNLPDQLAALVLADHPFHVIVTMDLKDVLAQALCCDCHHLKTDLEAQANRWMRESQGDPRLQPLPERVAIVVQVPKFESWIIADVLGLARSGYLTTEETSQSNVDEAVTDPARWLRERTRPGRNQKNPRYAKEIISHLCPETMRSSSRSFDKFFREVRHSYDCWCQAAFCSGCRCVT